MSTDIVTSPEPGDSQGCPVPTAAVEPDGVEPLWKKAAELLAERKRNAVELGKVLNELHDLYAKPGYGTFTDHIHAHGVSRSTAYRWIGMYRSEAGLPPLRDTFEEEEEIPVK